MKNRVLVSRLLSALMLSCIAWGGHASEEPASAPSAREAAKASSTARSAKGERAEKPAPAAEGKAAVSMAELRELIDQKIAEVRAKQEAAPVVRVNNHGARPRPTPRPARASEAHGHTAAHAPHWDYTGEGGPQNWARLKPEFGLCGTGKRQSPIDIRDGIKVQLEPIAFDYKPTAFRVLDNGHTVQVNLEPGNSITVHGRRYELLQFHFHRPSEERLNGRQFEMVAHLVHKDLDGQLAVVAVLMDQGKDHPMVQLVWNSLPLEKHTELRAPVMIDMNLMLPEQRQYLTYMGSLTTPPCSEGVLWLVLKEPATLSRDQIAIFSRLYPMNARPIQPSAGRLIKDGQ